SKEVEGMNMRPKDPARVRVDALHVAARKLADGCRSCADAYVNVARRNGAGEEEVHGVYASSSPRPEPTKSAPVAGFFGTSSMGERRRINTTDRNAGDNVKPSPIISRRGVVLPTSVSGVVAPRVFGHTSVPEIRTPLSYEEKVWRIAKWRRERGYPFDIHELPSPEDARQRKKLCDGGGGGNRTRVLKPRGQGIYARILRFGFAGPDSRRPDSDPASSLGLSRSSRSEEYRSSRLSAPDPRPPALRGERRYLIKQRVLVVYRRVCAVQLFNEDLDHLGAPPCFCLLSRDLSPPCSVLRHLFQPLLYHCPGRAADGSAPAFTAGAAAYAPRRSG